MNLLDRHIFKSVLFTCIGAVGLFAFVVALANFVRDLLGPLLAGQISVGMMIRLILLLFPFAVSYALPMGILTGVLLTLGRLSADTEVTAMRAAGISIVRIARPVFILAALGGVAALHVNFESMPWARVQYHQEFAEALRKNPRNFIVPKTFIRDFKGVVVYVGDRPNNGDLLRDIWIWELDAQGRAFRIVRAESGRLDYDAATNSIIPTLYRAKVEERDEKNPEDFSKSPKAPSIEKAEEIRLSLGGYIGDGVFHVKPEWLRYQALQEKRAAVDATKPEPGHEKEHARLSMELAMIVSEKANLSLAVFAFAFVAVPLGIKVSRRETSANLGVAVLLVLGFYILITMVKWLDRHPEYRPDLLMWVPNLIFLGFGFWLLRRVER
ncbi:LptF/LptG family permease [Opitutus sp. ER46]|uniref:LptF/LptG family permease n=1 Tax=Opitutus sp. ER46 TaxID=2161864 RepID=UPI000D3096A3|nr:LptF/LptG family permease [Opitutus sp. ER46]PTX98499.1 YjgP/YjgQ family permease [Opitutus sp. ER46]